MSIERKKPEVTTAIILDTRVTKKDDTHPIKLRVTFERKQKYFTLTGHSLSLEEFNKIFTAKPRGDYKQTRKFFDEIENNAITIIDDILDEFSFEGFQKVFRNKISSDDTIINFFDMKAKELEGRNKLQTAISYNATIKSLMEFEPRINFKKVNPLFLKDYENWMIKNGKSYTTIGIYLRNLRHIINLAIDKGIVKQENYPFGNRKDRYKIPKGDNIKKALSSNDIKRIFEFNSEVDQEKKAKAYWIFSYLCNGMNMADIANLRFKNIVSGNIRYIRQKTIDTSHDKKFIIVPLLPEALSIVAEFGNKKQSEDDYVFPIYLEFSDENEKLRRLKQHIKNTNKYMNRIARKLEINANLTTYWARHSFSTILKRSGAPTEFISEQLGHSSIKVTNSYLDSFEDETRKEWAKKLTDFKTVENVN